MRRTKGTWVIWKIIKAYTFNKSQSITAVIKISCGFFSLRSIPHWFVIPHKRLTALFFIIMILNSLATMLKFLSRYRVSSESVFKLRAGRKSISFAKSHHNTRSAWRIFVRDSHKVFRPHTKLSLNNNYDLIPQKINDLSLISFVFAFLPSYIHESNAAPPPRCVKRGPEKNPIKRDVLIKHTYSLLLSNVRNDSLVFVSAFLSNFVLYV